MAKCKKLTPLPFKGLKQSNISVTQHTEQEMTTVHFKMSAHNVIIRHQYVGKILQIKKRSSLKMACYERMQPESVYVEFNVPLDT